MVGDNRIPIVGVYLPPSSLHSLPELEEALNPYSGQKLTVLRDLHVDLMQPTNSQSHQVVAMLTNYGLEDMLLHFLQRSNFRHNKTWWQRYCGRIRCSCCDYILGSDCRLFKTITIQDPRHYTSNHYILQGWLLLRPQRSHKSYLQGHTRFPLKPPMGDQQSEVDIMFAQLKTFKEATPPVV